MRISKILSSALLVSLIGCALEVDSESQPRVAEDSLSSEANGNVVGSIQVDGPTAGADLFSNVGVPLNAGAALDWVADTAANSELTPGVDSAVGGVGHWNGLRLLDGVNTGDSNIFLSGGKENDTSTWNIGPGSVGSSKYDISQAYLANNQNNIYFGMERSGNNGTTAFDFEFNQLAPMSLASCPQNPQVPCRSVGDLLITFEMQGSGSSGSATPHRYTWNGSTYVEGAATGIVSSINLTANTAGAPWGHVDSHGNWVLGNMEKFTFAEATAPISLLPGVDNCGGKAYVQVRTRSSATPNSDLKDTTNVFAYVFNSVTAAASLTPSCDGTLGYSAAGFSPSGEELSEPACHWTFSDGSTSDLCSGTLQVPPGEYSATLELSDPNSPACSASADADPVVVLQQLSVQLSLQGQAPVCPMTNDGVTYDVVVSGGDGQYSYTWNGQSCSGTSCTLDSDGAFCAEQTVSVTVSDNSGMCVPATSETETYTKVTTVTATDN